MLAMMCFLAPSTRQPAGAKPSRLLARIVSRGQRTRCAAGGLRSPRLRAATRPRRRSLLWSWEWASRLAVDGCPIGARREPGFCLSRSCADISCGNISDAYRLFYGVAVSRGHSPSGFSSLTIANRFHFGWGIDSRQSDGLLFRQSVGSLWPPEYYDCRLPRKRGRVRDLGHGA